MKRLWIIGLVSLLALGVVGFSIAHPYFYGSQRNTPMMGHGYSNWGMPMMGRGWNMNWGIPMMGMMGSGYGCPMMGNQINQDLHATMAPIAKEQAVTIVQDYVQSLGNPNLKLGRVKESDTGFEIEIVTKDDSLVVKILVDKRTGLTQPIY